MKESGVLTLAAYVLTKPGGVVEAEEVKKRKRMRAAEEAKMDAVMKKSHGLSTVMCSTSMLWICAGLLAPSHGLEADMASEKRIVEQIGQVIRIEKRIEKITDVVDFSHGREAVIKAVIKFVINTALNSPCNKIDLDTPLFRSGALPRWLEAELACEKRIDFITAEMDFITASTPWSGDMICAISPFRIAISRSSVLPRWLEAELACEKRIDFITAEMDFITASTPWGGGTICAISRVSVLPRGLEAEKRIEKEIETDTKDYSFEPVGRRRITEERITEEGIREERAVDEELVARVGRKTNAKRMKGRGRVSRIHDLDIYDLDWGSRSSAADPKDDTAPGSCFGTGALHQHSNTRKALRHETIWG
jgi:hypothetical protein